MALIDRMRGKREATIAAAERRRPVRDINPDSWPFRVFKWWYWQKYRRPFTGQVNFCAYWRAVLLWAPGRLLQKAFPPILVVAAVLGLLAVAVWGFIWHTTGSLQLLGGIGALLYIVGSIYLGVTILRWVFGDVDVWDLDQCGSVALKWRIPYFVWCGLPGLALAIAFGILLGVLAVVLLAWELFFDKWRVHKVVGRGIGATFKGTVKALNAHTARLPWLRPWVLLPLISIGLVVKFGWEAGWIFYLEMVLCGITAAFVLVLGGIAWLHKLDESSERKEFETKRNLFAIPGFLEWYWSAVDSYSIYQSYSAEALNRESSPEDFANSHSLEETYEVVKAFLLMNTLDASQIQALPRQLRPNQPRKLRLRRTRSGLRYVGRFFVGAGEFIALLWSGIVYIKRVGACPYLKVTDQAHE